MIKVHLLEDTFGLHEGFVDAHATMRLLILQSILCILDFFYVGNPTI